jgi:hypothetical protein
MEFLKAYTTCTSELQSKVLAGMAEEEVEEGGRREEDRGREQEGNKV